MVGVLADFLCCPEDVAYLTSRTVIIVYQYSYERTYIYISSICTRHMFSRRWWSTSDDKCL